MTDGAMKTETLLTDDGVRLDARVVGPAEPSTTVVWCHPHPLMGGTMFAPLMSSVSDRLAAAGAGVLRFDFRGVGRSSGTHGGGIAEIADVDAAVRRAREMSASVVVAGWSFGAVVALRFVLGDPGGEACVGVAPPITDIAEFTRADGSLLAFVIGTRDAVVENDKILELAGIVGAHVRRTDADHLFTGRAAEVAETILGFVD